MTRLGTSAVIHYQLSTDLIFIFVVRVSSASYVVAIGVEVVYIVFLVTIKVFIQIKRCVHLLHLFIEVNGLLGRIAFLA